MVRPISLPSRERGNLSYVIHTISFIRITSAFLINLLLSIILYNTVPKRSSKGDISGTYSNLPFQVIYFYRDEVLVVYDKWDPGVNYSFYHK